MIFIIEYMLFTSWVLVDLSLAQLDVFVSGFHC